MADFLSQREGEQVARDERRFAEGVRTANPDQQANPFRLSAEEATARRDALAHAVDTRAADETVEQIVTRANAYLDFLRGNPEVATSASADPTD